MIQCGRCGNALAGSPRFCPSCGSPVEAQTDNAQRGDQRDAVSAKSPMRPVALFVFPLVLLAGLGIFYVYVNPSVNPVIREQPIISTAVSYGPEFVTMTNVAFKEVGSDLIFSLSELKQHRLVRFEYTGRATPRPVMGYVAPDGRLVTAISVSDHCGSTEFKIKDNKIYCAHCPSYWDMMTMEAYACCAKYYPDPIPSRVVGDEVHISREVVTKWAGRL